MVCTLYMCMYNSRLNCLLYFFPNSLLSTPGPPQCRSMPSPSSPMGVTSWLVLRLALGRLQLSFFPFSARYSTMALLPHLLMWVMYLYACRAYLGWAWPRTYMYMYMCCAGSTVSLACWAGARHYMYFAPCVVIAELGLWIVQFNFHACYM